MVIKNISALVSLNVSTLSELKDVIERLSPEVYTAYNPKGRATIGQHVRHILEFHTCLFEGSGEVNYDLRKRDIRIETIRSYAIECIDIISARMELTGLDTPLVLVSELPTVSNELLRIDSSLSRELFYVLEHAIHHMALIRVLIKDVDPDFDLSESFGVARSTLTYRRQGSSN